jgi:hypothetical protein
MNGTSHVDAFARGLAVIALGVALLSLYFTRRDVAWGRRSKGLTDIRPMLRDLRGVLETVQLDLAQATLLLWTPRNAANIAELDDGVAALSDWLLRRRIAKAVRTCRAAETPRANRLEVYEQQGVPVPPDAAQKVQAALSAVDDALVRLDKILRKAPK